VSRGKIALGLVAATAAGAVGAFKRADAGWRNTVDHIPPGDRLVPRGELRTVTTDDGAALAVTVAGPGRGPLVVLAHGFTNAREVWAPVAHRLVRSGAQVALYDHRGHGSSTSGTGGHTIERLGRDLAAVLEDLDARDAVLVGHSMGGMTIQSFAANHPDVVRDRVAALVLVATAAHGIGRGGRRDQQAAKAAGHPMAERFLASPVGHAFFRGVYGLAVRHADLTLSQDGFLATTAAAREQFTDAMLSMDLRKANAAIDVPTTVIVGARDTLLPPHLGEEVAASIPGARLVRLPHMGHMLPLEAPAEVAETVLGAVPIGRTERSLA
jgi:pimeloyl-ACP methyl ester carboxylesterase